MNRIENKGLEEMMFGVKILNLNDGGKGVAFAHHLHTEKSNLTY